jgi:hypothetical protein
MAANSVIRDAQTDKQRFIKRFLHLPASEKFAKIAKNPKKSKNPRYNLIFEI